MGSPDIEDVRSVKVSRETARRLVERESRAVDLGDTSNAAATVRSTFRTLWIRLKTTEVSE